MEVTDDQVATLRAVLANDFDEYDRLRPRLDPELAKVGYTGLVAAGFFEAADRRFGHKDATRRDVIEFVAKARNRFDPDGDRINPDAAERMVLAVVSDVSIDDLDETTVVELETLLLRALIADAELDDAGLDEFLATARKLANQWIAADEAERG